MRYSFEARCKGFRCSHLFVNFDDRETASLRCENSLNLCSARRKKYVTTHRLGHIEYSDCHLIAESNEYADFGMDYTRS